MELENIRQKLKNKGAFNKSIKEVTCDWLAHECDARFQLGLTLMPKKVFYKRAYDYKRHRGRNLYRHLSKDELQSASFRFIHILNSLVYKKAYPRYNKKLDVVMAIEGENSYKDLHTHFAFTMPTNRKLNDFAKLVIKAIYISDDFVIYDPTYKPNNKDEWDRLDEKYRYKLDITDSGWLGYITKEADNKNLDNLYLP